MKTRISKIWEKTDKVQRVLLILAFAFLILARLLTWYAVTYLGLKEADLTVAGYIQRFGAPLGLFISCVIMIGFIFFSWLIWVQFFSSLKYQRRWQWAVNLISTFLLTSIFMLFFWTVFFDFTHDAAVVFFGSNVFSPFLEFSPPAILALISAAIYLKFCHNSKKLASRKRKRGA